MTLLPRLSPGCRIGRFTVKETRAHPTHPAVRLAHDAGAEHVHVFTAEDQFSFGLCMLTPAVDNRGTTHALEHLVLQGSWQFPVRDAFGAMASRGLATHLNAETTDDCTTFYFHTPHPQDFEHLLRVTLDAVFFPLLTDGDFHREVVRMAPTSLPSGVLYNEMVGAYADPGTRLWPLLGRALYPDLAYRFDFAGDPEEIPRLSPAALRGYHRVHYRPGRALLYSAGPLALSRVLGLVEAAALRHFADGGPERPAPEQKPFTRPVRLEATCPAAPGEHGGHAVVAWTLPFARQDQARLWQWRVLARLLVGEPDAALARALRTCGLGTDLAAVSGLHTAYRQPAFAAGLQGVAAADLNRVEPLLLSAIAAAAAQGFGSEAIAAAVAQEQLAARRGSRPDLPPGLRVWQRMLEPWHDGGEPLLNLDPAEAAWGDPGEGCTEAALAERLRQDLLAQPHRASLTLFPDPRPVPAPAGPAPADDEVDAPLANQAPLPTLQARALGAARALPAFQVGQLGETAGVRLDTPADGLCWLEVQVRLHSLGMDQCGLLPTYGQVLQRRLHRHLRDACARTGVPAALGVSVEALALDHPRRPEQVTRQGALRAGPGRGGRPHSEPAAFAPLLVTRH